MKFLFIFGLVFSFSLSAAVEFKFIGPCSEKFIMRITVLDSYENVGDLTIETLKKFEIPFVGTSIGLASAFKTPTGDAAVEVVSDDELRAYGWCYSVDGSAPEVYPDQIPVTTETRSIIWHFGFARFFQGKWITQCTPAWKVRPAFLCKD